MLVWIRFVQYLALIFSIKDVPWFNIFEWFENFASAVLFLRPSMFAKSSESVNNSLREDLLVYVFYVSIAAYAVLWTLVTARVLYYKCRYVAGDC